MYGKFRMKGGVNRIVLRLFLGTVVLVGEGLSSLSPINAGLGNKRRLKCQHG